MMHCQEPMRIVQSRQQRGLITGGDNRRSPTRSNITIGVRLAPIIFPKHTISASASNPDFVTSSSWILNHSSSPDRPTGKEVSGVFHLFRFSAFGVIPTEYKRWIDPTHW